jgi:hypothetical protein
MPKETTQRTTADLTPESRIALSGELDFLVGQLGPEQRGLQQNFLDLIEPQQGNYLQGDTLGTLNLGQGALGSTSQEAGLSPDSIARIMDNIGQLQPQALDSLRGVGQQGAAQVNSQVDPRYNFALRPESTTTADDGGASAIQAGIAIAGIIALFAN